MTSSVPPRDSASPPALDDGFGTRLFARTLGEVTPEFLSRMIAPYSPGAKIEHIQKSDARGYGDDMVSSAARVTLDARYSQGAPNDLPTRLLLKYAVQELLIGPIYRNEARIYNLLRPWEFMQTPRSLGASYDPDTQQFALLLEDVKDGGSIFPNVLSEVTPEHVRSLLDQLARLHARYWESPRFAMDLDWLETHVTGTLANFMNTHVKALVEAQVEMEHFKRELVAKLGTSVEKLSVGTRAVHLHQATLPQTITHGDAHLGNTYRRPDGCGGFVDWQLTARGYCMHDVSYLVTTSLPIDQRRRHERDLLAYYLDRLAAHGVTNVPQFGQTFTEYRRAMIWGFYIGWLTTPVRGYGWEIVVGNHLRTSTVYEDHETDKLMAELL
jgi:hypothetical protein